MIEGFVDEPLSRYRDEFRERFSELVSEKFEELRVSSGVDENANRILVHNIRTLQSQRENASKRHALWQYFGILLLVGIIAGIGLLIHDYLQWSGPNYDEIGAFFRQRFTSFTKGSVSALTAAGCGLLLIFVVVPHSKRLSKKIARLDEQISVRLDEAWNQMSPLNDLYTWEMMTDLIEKTVPGISFDPYFTTRRLIELKQNFQWDDEYNEDESVLFSHSGEINGNPFVFGDLKEMHWENKVYTGTRIIHWTERVTDSNGRSKLVSRSETLVARVEKPVPVYGHDKFLLYGNHAAPNLTFSREPSELSGAGDGFFANMKKRSKLKDLKALARNLDDDLDFTMMSNEEFELLFHAINRDHEVEFRLLFTPLAQQQMVNLLKDQEVGFGDDFMFVKSGCMNLLRARHLNGLDFSNDPSRFHHYSMEDARTYFQETLEGFFKSIYFALAPFLTIPLYQQIKSDEHPYEEHFGEKASFWEHEALANHYGVEHFKHPDCITDCILKAEVGADLPDGSSVVLITAHGFRGEERIDYPVVYGGDGKFHEVPVRWIKYFPVQQTSEICVTELPEETQEEVDRVQGILNNWNDQYSNLTYRRSLYACLRR